MTAMADRIEHRLGRAGARRADQAAARRPAAARAGPAGRDRAGRPGAARAAGAARSSSTSTTGTRTSTSTASPCSSRRSSSRDRLPGGAPTWSSGWPRCCTTSASRRPARSSPAARCSFHHHDVVGAKLARKRLTALRFSNDEIEAVSRAGRAAPAVPRLRHGQRRLDRLRRAPLRPRRRRPAGAAAHPDPGRLHDAEQGARPPGCGGVRRSRGRGSPSSPSRRSWPRCAPTWTAPRSWRSSTCRPGPDVGRAYHYLLERRIDDGPLGPDRARDELLAWWAAGALTAQTGSASRDSVPSFMLIPRLASANHAPISR